MGRRNIAPSTVAQHAALAAFHPDTTTILEARRHEFSLRREVLLPGLRQLGFEIAAEPRGAFYVYAGSSGLAADSFSLAGQLLTEAGVAATPGLDFGSNAPQGHMRFAYTIDRVQIEEGLARMATFLNSRKTHAAVGAKLSEANVKGSARP